MINNIDSLRHEMECRADISNSQQPQNIPIFTQEISGDIIDLNILSTYEREQLKERVIGYLPLK